MKKNKKRNKKIGAQIAIAKRKKIQRYQTLYIEIISKDKVLVKQTVEDDKGVRET